MKFAIIVAALATLAAGSVHAQAQGGCSYDKVNHRVTCPGPTAAQTASQPPRWNGQKTGMGATPLAGYRATRAAAPSPYVAPVGAINTQALARPARAPVCTHNYVLNTDTCR